MGHGDVHLHRVIIVVVPVVESRDAAARLAVGDLAALNAAVAQDPAAPGERFVLGEGLYSMDGDRGPVAEQAAICARHQGWLLIDEAHAVGVLGPQGRGVCAEAGVDDHPRLLARVGTFGKALGGHGAFIACDAATRDLIVNAGRTYVFTTALPPASAGAALEALRIVQSNEGAERRAAVVTHAARVVAAAQDRGLAVSGVDPERPGPIVPIVLGHAQRALDVAAALLNSGIYAKAIRPPTVAPGTSRLRITVSAAHSAADVDLLIDALARAI